MAKKNTKKRGKWRKKDKMTTFYVTKTGNFQECCGFLDPYYKANQSNLDLSLHWLYTGVASTLVINKYLRTRLRISTISIYRKQQQNV